MYLTSEYFWVFAQPQFYQVYMNLGTNWWQKQMRPRFSLEKSKGVTQDAFTIQNIPVHSANSVKEKPVTKRRYTSTKKLFSHASKSG